MKAKFLDYFMKVAQATAELSTATRLQVGSVIVRGNQILATGYNGTPSGWDNTCEDVETTYDERDTYYSTDWKFNENDKKFYRTKTKPIVLHSEANAITKVARSTESSEGSTLFCTHAPCLDCAKLIYQSGINSVYYRNTYRDTAGVEFLEKSGVSVQRYNP